MAGPDEKFIFDKAEEIPPIVFFHFHSHKADLILLECGMDLVIYRSRSERKRSHIRNTSIKNNKKVRF